MHDERMSEKEFLKNFALRQFNSQRGLRGDQAIRAEDCDIFSVPAKPGNRYGYEIFTRRLNDSFRLRIYFNVGYTDVLSRFHIQLSPPYITGRLGDEVWVANGLLDTAHVYYHGYRLEWIHIDPSQLPVVLTAQRQPLRLANGGFLILSKGYAT